MILLSSSIFRTEKGSLLQAFSAKISTFFPTSSPTAVVSGVFDDGDSNRGYLES
jgi:hypothetical protein